jgi:hypothetical protein
MGMMKLSELLGWLEDRDPDTVVIDGFGEPHCDRGRYEDLAFTPVPRTTFGRMLDYARYARGKIFEGWGAGITEWMKGRTVLSATPGNAESR